MDDFADYEGSGGGGKAEFLKWKDDKSGDCEVYLLTAPVWVWRHNWKRVAKFKEKGGEEVEKVSMYSWNTMEPAEKEDKNLKRLKKQGYWYDAKPEEIDEREEPEVDPFLKMLEWVFRAVVTGKIDWLDEVFKFEAADSDDVVIHAGGLLGMYPQNFDEFDKDEVEKQKKKFKAAGVSLKDAFKEKSTIGLKYVFTVVDNGHPEDGPKLAIESEALGNAVKRVYKDRVTRYKGDRDKANPIKKICFKWEFDNSQHFEKKYRVVELDEEPSDEVKEVFAQEELDISRITGQGNVAVLRKNFEDHWCHQVVPDWDAIFAAAEKAVAGTEHASLPGDFNHGANEKSADKQEDKSDADDTSEDPTVPCEACGREMPDTAMVCPHCDAKYVQVGAFVCLENIACEACGKQRPSKEMTCPHCKAEYVEGEEKIELKPKPEPVKEEVRAPRRQAQRQAAKS